LGGGDWLKFGDVVIATAAMVFFGLVLEAVLMVAFAPLNSPRMSAIIAALVSFLVVSLIVGYTFALSIREESRIRAIGSITVLFAAAMLFFAAIWMSNPFASPWVKESLNSMFNTSGFTNYDWNAYSAFDGSIEVILASIVSFIGLYVGSMLRRH
jgi:high-affinity Fe2+/Pb2+ permease